MPKKQTKKQTSKQTKRQAKKPTGAVSKNPPAEKRSVKAPPRVAGGHETKADSAALASLRKQIDRIDSRLVKLLNERAQQVVEVGKLKRGSNTPIYAPHREAAVLQRVLGLSEGPLPASTIEAVFRELMSGSFALEQPLRIGYLGPAGSHSHAAAIKQFGSSVEYENLRTIEGVFTEVRRGHVSYGLVPIENSTGGGIVETLDAFKQHAGKISVYAELQINIHHTLLSAARPEDVREIHSKPEVFQQCQHWLTTQYPRAERIAAASSSRAVQTVAEMTREAVARGREPEVAAIGNELAGKLYGLSVLFPKIEDNPDNITRFFVISRQKALRTGDDKTSIMFTTEDKAGALVDVLGVFHALGINLSHIDKRPSGRENWSYTFFVDATGHRDDDSMAAAAARVKAHCREMIVLGSYPRSTRIL